MKNKIYISQKWRRLTALFLLLNFFVSPVINAFPQEECNGVCEMISMTHECDTDTTIKAEMTCCNMMEMNSSAPPTSSECGMELSDINCALVYHGQANPVYLIPKTIDSKIEFIQITIIDFKEENSKIEIFEFLEDYSYIHKPPIYLTNSVFLI